MAPFPVFVAQAGPIPAVGGESPTKFSPFKAGEYARLIEAPLHPVISASAEVDVHVPSEEEDEDDKEDEDEEDEEGAAVELEGDSLDPTLLVANDKLQLQKKYPSWWSEHRHARFSTSTVHLSTLPPAFYSPSTFSPTLFDGDRPSHNVSSPSHASPLSPHPATPPRRLSILRHHVSHIRCSRPLPQAHANLEPPRPTRSVYSSLCLTAGNKAPAEATLPTLLAPT